MVSVEISYIIGKLNNITTLLSEKYQLDNIEGKNFIESLETLKNQLIKIFPYDSNQEDLYEQIKRIESTLQDVQKQKSEINKIHEDLTRVSSDNEKIIQILKENIQKQDRCPLLDNKVNEESLKLVTFVKEDKEGINYLKEFTKDARELIIIDPYILMANSPDQDDINDYLDNFFNVINFKSNKDNLKSIRLIYDKWEHNISDIIRDAMYNATESRIFKLKFSQKIHDRIWIKNQESAMFVGASLNGLGNKLNILVPLPEDDLKNVIKFLNSEDLFNDSPRKSSYKYTG